MSGVVDNLFLRVKLILEVHETCTELPIETGSQEPSSLGSSPPGKIS